jgi:hypothetical protein
MPSPQRKTPRAHCHKRGSHQLAAAAVVWNVPERVADLNRFSEITSQILEWEVTCAVAVDDSDCTIQDVARMCYLLQRWREHRDLLRAIEETFPVSGVDPIASTLPQLEVPAIAKALRAFVNTELAAFADAARSEEKSALGCITWSWYMQQNLTEAVNDLVPQV